MVETLRNMKRLYIFKQIFSFEKIIHLKQDNYRKKIGGNIVYIKLVF